MTAVAEIAKAVTPFATTFKTLVLPIANPVLVPPENRSDGDTADPAGTVKLPERVPPVNGKFREATPVKLAVMMPAEKFPEVSRATMALAVFKFVAVVAELLTKPALINVASLEFAIAAELAMSALTMSEVENTPDALLCTTPAEAKAGNEKPVGEIVTMVVPLAMKLS